MYKTTKYFDSNNFWGRPLNLYGRFQGLIPTTHPHRIMYHPKLCETDSERTQDEGGRGGDVRWRLGRGGSGLADVGK